MEKEIKQANFSSDIRLISSKDGIFDIKVDDRLIFSKKSLKRFPKPNEISEILMTFYE